MGGCAVRGGGLALYEKSCHYINMGMEPIRYDGEEGKWEKGCISSFGVINNDEVAIWPGLNGILIFNGEPVDLTEMVLRDTYKAMIASEYSENNNSYEGIVGAYSQKQNLFVWTFPNCIEAIGDLTLKMLAYDPG